MEGIGIFSFDESARCSSDTIDKVRISRRKLFEGIPIYRYGFCIRWDLSSETDAFICFDI
jgi:hypothetical protein